MTSSVLKWLACLRDEIEHMESRDVGIESGEEEAREEGCEKNGGGDGGDGGGRKGSSVRDEGERERRRIREREETVGRDCDQSHLLHCPGN